jgi:hypothetical protein
MNLANGIGLGLEPKTERRVAALSPFAIAFRDCSPPDRDRGGP